MQLFTLTLSQKLEYAVESDDKEYAEYYLNLGFNPNAVNSEGKPLIIKAAEEGKNDIVRLFLKYQANPDCSFRGTHLIHILAQREEYALVKEILTEYNGSSKVFDAQGRTILELIYDQDFDAFLPFINEGIVDPNLKNKRGDTILHHILTSPKVYETGIQGILALVEQDVDLNMRSGSTGETPLRMAYLKFGAVGAINLMINGADPNEVGDRRLGAASLIFVSAWELRHSPVEAMGGINPALFWATALRYGAKAAEDEPIEKKRMIYGAVRDLNYHLFAELYEVPSDRTIVSDLKLPSAEGITGILDQDNKHVESLRLRFHERTSLDERRVAITNARQVRIEIEKIRILEKFRVELLKTMDDAGWGTFAEAYQKRDTHLWMALLERGVKPPVGIAIDEVIYEVLDDSKLQADQPRRKQILLGMQAAGWELARVAYQRGFREDLFMLLENGAKPPKTAFNQEVLFRFVATDVERRTKIVHKMIKNGWDIIAFSKDVIKRKDFPLVHFVIQMGAVIKEGVDWQTLRKNRPYKELVLPGLGHLLPTDLGSRCTETTYVVRLLDRIRDYNAAHNEGKVNPLEVMLFIHSEVGIRRLLRQTAFEEFSAMLTDVARKYPYIDVEWFWSKVLEIPPSHYANFANVKAGADHLPKLPYTVPMDYILRCYDQINFKNNKGPRYLGGVKYREGRTVLSHAQIRGGIAYIIRRIRYNLVDPGVPGDPVKRREVYDAHQKRLEVVAFYLQFKWDKDGNPIEDSNGEYILEDPRSTEPLDEHKARVLIDHGIAGTHCAARWKDIFYQCRCRLSNEAQVNLSFVDQLRALWGNERSFVLQEIVGSGGESGGAYENALYHLRNRGVPGDRPDVLIRWAQYGRPHQGGALIQDFDGRYHLERMLRVFKEHMEQDNQAGNDFRELMHAWMGDSLAQVAQLSCENSTSLKHLRRLAREKGVEDKRLPYPQIEAFMRPYKDDYEAQKFLPATITEFFQRLNMDSFLKPFSGIIQLPGSDVMDGVFNARIAVMRKTLLDLTKIFLRDGEREEYVRLKWEMEEAKARLLPLEQELQLSLAKVPEEETEYDRLKEEVVYKSKDSEEVARFEVLVKKHAPDGYKTVKQEVEDAIQAFGAFFYSS